MWNFLLKEKCNLYKGETVEMADTLFYVSVGYIHCSLPSTFSKKRAMITMRGFSGKYQFNRKIRISPEIGSNFFKNPKKKKKKLRKSEVEGAASVPFSSKGGLGLVSQFLSSSSFSSSSFSFRPFKLDWVFSYSGRAFMIYTWYEPLNLLIFFYEY